MKFTMYNSSNQASLLLCERCRPDATEWLTTAEISALCGIEEPVCERCQNQHPLREHKIRNLTPHPVRLVCDYGEYEFPSEGVIRCSERRIQRSSLDLTFAADCRISGSVEPYQTAWVPVNEVFLSKSSELPPFRSDTTLIVSRMVAQAHPERIDMVFPDEVMRDVDGNIVSCRSFARVCMDVNTHGEAVVRLHE